MSSVGRKAEKVRTLPIIGVDGYVASRPLLAIRDTRSRLVAAVDPQDSVGVLDQYLPDSACFTEFKCFDRPSEQLRRGPGDDRVDFLSICPPQHFHNAHVPTALRVGADTICEQQLLMNPWSLDVLQELEAGYGRNVNTALQLRVHQRLLEPREQLRQDGGRRHSV